MCGFSNIEKKFERGCALEDRKEDGSGIKKGPVLGIGRGTDWSGARLMVDGYEKCRKLVLGGVDGKRRKI